MVQSICSTILPLVKISFDLASKSLGVFNLLQTTAGGLCSKHQMSWCKEWLKIVNFLYSKLQNITFRTAKPKVKAVQFPWIRVEFFQTTDFRLIIPATFKYWIRNSVREDKMSRHCLEFRLVHPVQSNSASAVVVTCRIPLILRGLWSPHCRQSLTALTVW